MIDLSLNFRQTLRKKDSYVLPLLKSVPWTLAEFNHNRIVQSHHENYFNACRQLKEK